MAKFRISAFRVSGFQHMRIAIDCRTILNPGLGEGAGVGHYVYFLVKHLLAAGRSERFLLFFDRRLSKGAAESFVGDSRNAETVFLPFGRYKKFLPLAYNHLLVAGAIAERKPDLVHVPAGATPLTLRIPTVLTVHDLAIYGHPAWFPKQDLSVKVTYPAAIRAAARIITVSEATKRDLVGRFRVPPRKVTAIHPGVDLPDRQAGTRGSSLFKGDPLSEDDAVDWGDIARRYRLTKPYVLFLGTLEPRKNVAGLCEAFVAAWKESPAVRGTELLLAGAPGFAAGGALAAAKRAGNVTRGAVRLLGYVPHRDKFPLMRSARVFAFPSLAEGFGLPVAEALALGVPTVVSDIPVFREVAGTAALFADPGNPAALAAALIEAIADGAVRDRLAEAGPLRARRFSWAKAAWETLAVYRAAAAS